MKLYIEMVYLTRRERFNAAHKLWVDDWSEEKNIAWFGKCANRNWHGHNYELWVTVAGEPSKETGFVIDLSELGRLMKLHVIDKLDHKNIDLDVDFMKGIYSSTENLALHCVKLQETENNYVEYQGQKAR